MKINMNRVINSLKIPFKIRICYQLLIVLTIVAILGAATFVSGDFFWIFIGFACVLLGYAGLGRRVCVLAKRVAMAGISGELVSWKSLLIRDELGDVVDSFNELSGRAEDLFLQVADRVEVEKEVQTAQIVQSLFYPAQGFEHANLRVCGRILTATQCGGDWWNFSHLSDHLVIGVGDATGHGVAAALMMAALHGGYAIAMKQQEAGGATIPSLPHIMDCANVSCHSVSGGENTVTFVGSVIDLESGVLTVANASHPSPFLYRSGLGPERGPEAVSPDGASSDIRKIFKSIKAPPTKALGFKGELGVETLSINLEPGDVLFWYTDGIFNIQTDEGFQRSGGMIDRMSLLRYFKRVADQQFPNENSICDDILKRFLTKRGEVPDSFADDVTLVVGVVPSTARFKRRPAP